MRYFLLLTLFLTACSTTVPIKPKFPEADAFMMEPAPKLDALPADTTDLDKLLLNAADNFGKYRELTKRYEMWQEWYKQQKELYESIK